MNNSNAIITYHPQWGSWIISEKDYAWARSTFERRKKKKVVQWEDKGPSEKRGR